MDRPFENERTEELLEVKYTIGKHDDYEDSIKIPKDIFVEALKIWCLDKNKVEIIGSEDDIEKLFNDKLDDYYDISSDSDFQEICRELYYQSKYYPADQKYYEWLNSEEIEEREQTDLGEELENEITDFETRRLANNVIDIIKDVYKNDSLEEAIYSIRSCFKTLDYEDAIDLIRSLLIEEDEKYLMDWIMRLVKSDVEGTKSWIKKYDRKDIDIGE